MPSSTRENTSIAIDDDRMIGSCAMLQMLAITSSSHFALTRLAMNPPITPEAENSQKKLPAIQPNSVGDSFSSLIIGTATRPMTTLSMKLISMNSASSTVMNQARPGSYGLL